MLGDAEIQALEAPQKIVQKFLDEFQIVIEDYNRSKSDYEEEESREVYGELVKTQFKDHLIKAGAQGGGKAAQLLNDAVRELVHEQRGSQAGQCRIMVRIYSNIRELSKTLARAGLVGNEARPFSTFASSFSAAQHLFDYVDAGDKKEGGQHKIRETFRLFADNAQCKHVFFAGCHDASYLSMLAPYRDRSDRITLINAASFHREFSGLELAVRELPAVFMSTQITESQIPSTIPSSSRTTSSTAIVCTHYQKGICRYGDQCTKVHIIPGQQLSKDGGDSLLPPIPSHVKSSTTGIRNWEFYATSLPSIDTGSLKYIAVNKYGERIDPYTPMPSKVNLDAYAQRTRSPKLCNAHHLAGSCTNKSCAFDHGSIGSGLLDTLQYFVRQRKCSKGAYCRSPQCYFGHHCQKGGCRGFGPCRFAQADHALDVVVARWVKPTARLQFTSEHECGPSGKKHKLNDGNAASQGSGSGPGSEPGSESGFEQDQSEQLANTNSMADDDEMLIII
ncbi:zinc finger CCCH domain-containing protein [Aspergillus undulatus]|uniref:zinc finger CCCH domain-containing protein n=1 Tax=Aspergillus undulatus TaxID=1810928 RepID=UPI003CCD5987